MEIRHQGPFIFIKNKTGRRECDYKSCDKCKEHLVEKMITKNGLLLYGTYYLDQQEVNLLETKKSTQYTMPKYYGD